MMQLPLTLGVAGIVIDRNGLIISSLKASAFALAEQRLLDIQHLLPRHNDSNTESLVAVAPRFGSTAQGRSPAPSP